MRPVLRLSSAFATLFRLGFGLVDHPIAWRRSDQHACLSSGRFSPWFGRLSRRSQLRQNVGQRPAHLLWRGLPLAALPGTQVCLHLGTRQQQMIMHDSDDLAPALKLRWGAQSGHSPQQVLFLEAIAMLVRVAPSIAQGHLGDTGLWRAVPQKPTLPRVAGTIAGLMPQYTDDRHLDVSCLRQMQPVPPSDLNEMPLGIGALPTARGLPIGVGVATLKALPIFARRSAFAGRSRGRAIQHALALEAQQFVERQSLGGQQKGRATVP